MKAQQFDAAMNRIIDLESQIHQHEELKMKQKRMLGETVIQHAEEMRVRSYIICQKLSNILLNFLRCNALQYCHYLICTYNVIYFITVIKLIYRYITFEQL